MVYFEFSGDSNTNTYPKKEFKQGGFLSYSEHIAKTLGGTHKVFARGGSTYCGPSPSSADRQGFLHTNAFRELRDSRNADGGQYPDVAIVCLGTNDAHYFPDKVIGHAASWAREFLTILKAPRSIYEYSSLFIKNHLFSPL